MIPRCTDCRRREFCDTDPDLEEQVDEDGCYLFIPMIEICDDVSEAQ